jgi:hypothetical protein
MAQRAQATNNDSSGAKHAFRPSTPILYAMNETWHRVRVVFGIIAVGVGAVWAGGGLGALREAGMATLRILPVALVAIGLFLMLRAAIPHGRMVGPFLVLAIGVITVAIQWHGLSTALTRTAVPVALILVGLLVALLDRSGRSTPSSLVITATSVVFPRQLRIVNGADTPSKVILRCVLGSIVVDLTETVYPRQERPVTVDVTIVGGRVELIVPLDWHVRANRIEYGHGINYVGGANFPQAASAEELDDIDDLVVINVQGWSGVAALQRQQVYRSGPSDRADQFPSASASAVAHAEIVDGPAYPPSVPTAATPAPDPAPVPEGTVGSG